MKKLNKLLFFLRSYLTVLGIFILAFSFFYFTNGLNIRNLLEKASIVSTKQPVKAVVPSQLNGWIAWWDENSALTSLKKNSQNLKSISPVWYKIDTNGALQQIPHSQEAQIKFLSQQANIKLVPSIANDFDPGRISIIVNNSDAGQSLMEELANLAVQNNYQGFDIDWEEIDPKDQVLFSLFIQKLAEFLHTYNLVVTVSVHPQTGQDSDRKVAKGYKLAELSKAADGLKIMAYDFHNIDSELGAITPFKELKQVLDYTISVVPADKIILGLPTYGYDWTEGSGKSAEAVSFTEATNRIKQNNGQSTRDSESNSLIGSYNLAGKKHTIWFEDAETLNKMIDLARSSGIYQFSFWRIGTEDPDFWSGIPLR